jgi:hypothetical protein
MNTNITLSLVTIDWSCLWTLGEDLISLECLILNAIALVRCSKCENLDAMNGGVVGVFIAPTTKSGHLRHRTLSGAPATSAGRWVLTVGALTGGPSGLSGGAPNRSCRLSGAPSARALSSARAGAH